MKFKKIIFGATVNSKAELFSLIANEFLKEGVVNNEADFINALNEREEMVSTGLIDGIAIPHGKSSAVLQNEAMIITLKNPIAYETLDDSEVKFVFSLAISAENDNHLERLSQLSTKLMEEECIQGLQTAQNAADIERLFLS